MESPQYSLRADKNGARNPFDFKTSDYYKGMLEQELNMEKQDVDDSVMHPHMHQLRYMHRSIQDTINEIQGKTTRILQDQERDLLRCFRTRLSEVTDELERERRKNESGSIEWVQKCRKLNEELEYLRGNLNKVQEENTTNIKEVKKMRRQLKTHNEDREFLIKQLVAVKKENARLLFIEENKPSVPPAVSEDGGEEAAAGTDAAGGGAATTRAASSMGFHPTSARAGSRPLSAMSRPQTAKRRATLATSTPKTTPPATNTVKHLEQVLELEQRYKSVITRLKFQVENEEQKIRDLRTAHNHEKGIRLELQNIFQHCLEEVWREEANTKEKQTENAERGAVAPHPLSLIPSQRIKLMASFLSQDSVIKLVYDKIFPVSKDGIMRPATSFGEYTSLSGRNTSASALYARPTAAAVPHFPVHRPGSASTNNDIKSRRGDAHTSAESDGDASGSDDPLSLPHQSTRDDADGSCRSSLSTATAARSLVPPIIREEKVVLDDKTYYSGIIHEAAAQINQEKSHPNHYSLTNHSLGSSASRSSVSFNPKSSVTSSHPSSRVSATGRTSSTNPSSFFSAM